MGRLYRQKLVLGAIAAVSLLAANVAVTLINTRRLQEHGSWVAHTHEVIIGLESLVSLVKDAETGQRGYIITGEPRYLAPYTASIASMDAQVDEVQRLTGDNPRQQSRFRELRKRIADRLGILDEGIAARKTGTFETAREVILTDRGKTEMDALRDIVGEMIAEEQGLLRNRELRLSETYRRTVSTELISGLSAVAAVIAFMVLLWRHLAARAASEHVIAEQAERLRTTLASIGDAVITTDMEGGITNMNAVAEALTGWTNAAATGQPLDAVFRIVNEETRNPVENPATRALRDGVIVGLANHTVLVAKDGTERPIDDSAAPIRCKAGEIVGCVLVFRDVTERRQGEEKRREHERRFRTLVEQIKDYAIFMIDRDGRATSWHEGVRRVLGFDEPEFVGKDITTRIFTPEDVQAGVPERELREAAATGAANNTRWMRRRDGTAFFAVGATTSLRDDSGDLVGFMKVMRDQTEQKRMEDDLRQLAAELSEADRRKNEFLAMLAHELRNPLAPIRNAMQVIRLKGGEGEAGAAASEMMERQISQLVRLVDDLLDVSRITRGTIELRKERVELASAVQHAVEAAKSMMQCMDHELMMTLLTEPVYLTADPTRLAQVIGNLLSNACKFTDKGGRIHLAVEREGEQAVIRVRDNGVGIAAEELPRIFDMFMQIDTSLERSVSGLGIGLTLVKNLVEMHGGTVEVHSAGIGKGSEFVVRLPIAAAVPAVATAPASKPGLGTSKARSFLVVDDNEDSATSLAMLLKMTGNETQVAYDGLGAVEAAEKFKPDVVLLDIGLPKLNGYEACRRIRAQPWGRDMMLIALTGWGQDEDRQKSKDAGFNGHLVKPVEHASLMKLLAEL